MPDSLFDIMPIITTTQNQHNYKESCRPEKWNAQASVAESSVNITQETKQYRLLRSALETTAMS